MPAPHRDLPADIFMYIGDWEVPGPDRRNTSGADMVADVRAMERNLKSRNYPHLTVQSLVLQDEDHLTVAPVGFTRALIGGSARPSLTRRLRRSACASPPP